MGAPASGMKAGEQQAAETLLSAFRTIPAAERRRHASVLNYWLSIRGDKEFPPLHDLDPLELSDAGPNSILFELLSGGHDAEIRHMGEALRDGDWPERILDAETNSVLSCIAKKLPIVAISRDFLAFEDEFEGAAGKSHCWVTLLPLSAGGAWVDYVYALVSTDGASAKKGKATEAPANKAEAPDEADVDTEEVMAATDEGQIAETDEPIAATIEAQEEPVAEDVAEPDQSDGSGQVGDDLDEEQAAEAVAKAAPGFSKLLDSIAGLTGFYGSNPVKVEPVAPEPSAAEAVGEEPAQVAPQPIMEPEELVEDEPVATAPADDQPEEPVAPVDEQPTAEEPADVTPAGPDNLQSASSEGPLQTRLADIRAKADEARHARLRASAALIEGVSAAYDFALDAEEEPEEYLRLVEAQGLKIQLRAPMKPVVKLAFDGLADSATINELEAVLAWALKQDLPRGSLAGRIEQAGGIDKILAR